LFSEKVNKCRCCFRYF